MRKSVLLLMGVLFLSLQLLAQRVITGKVTDDKGLPLINISVTVKGTTAGTITNSEGFYSLSVPANGKTLVFSGVDMGTQEVTISSAATVSVTLRVQEKSMDEVVVTAYGSNIKRSSFTGSAAQVSGKDLEKRTVSNALSALVGAAPGIQTTTPSGAPGSSPGIIVRGFGSYSLTSSPLYVVDGVIYDGGFSNINPDDIETITVLKDASTTALYGSKGANGVVMITTRKARKGRQTLQFKVQTGFSNPAIERYPTTTADQYYPLAWESYRNGLVNGSNIPLAIANNLATGTMPRNGAGNQIYLSGQYQDIYQLLGKYNPYNVGNTDIVRIDGTLNPAASLLYADDLNWLDQASRTGTRNEYGVLFGSGSEKSDVSASFNYLKDAGWGLRSDFSRFSGRVTANVTPTSWFKTGFNISANRSKFNNAATGGIVNPFYFARYAAPIYPVHLRQQGTGAVILDALGKPRFDYGNENGYTRPFNSGRHSIAEHLLNKDNSLRDALSARTYGEVIFTPWLKFTTNISLDVTNTETEGYENPFVGDGYPSGRYSRGQSRSTSHTFNQLLNFSKKFGYNTFDVLVGHENYNNLSTGLSGMRIGQSFDDIYVYSNFITINSLNSSVSENRSEGYFSRVNYDYANKYLLSASFRRDGNSRFPKDIRWANFWSVGAAWKIDEEKFFNANWVDMLKLRASYGVTGNSETGNYPYQAGYSIGYDDDTRPGVALSSLGSPDLTWETQKPFDLGLDFAFFKNRLSGTIGYFIRNSSGLIFDVPQPLQNGGTNGGNYTIAQNIGSMTNKGVEVQLTGNIVRKKDFNWNITVNATSYENKLTKMPEVTPVLTSNPFRREVGRSIYEFYTRTFYGVDPADGQALYLGAITYNPANTRLKDNGKGGTDTVTIDHNNARQTYVGKTSIPDVYGSIVNSISYKSFQLDFTFTYQLGGAVYDGVYATLMTADPISGGRTLHTDILNRWQKPGDITNVPRLDNTRSAQYGTTSTRFLTNASYLSLNNINLSYQLPKTLLSKIGAANATLFINAENVRFFSKRKGMNVNGDFSGLTGDTYDAARVINAGVRFNF